MILNKPFLSVALITYNQEDFIAQCLEGMVHQKTDFSFEIVIGEDCSTDNTRAICLEYVQKYPNLIRLITRENNLGMMGNWISTINACNGKYVAICEGDDYWIDNQKLQKQVDFLEQNSNFSLCATLSYELQCEDLNIEIVTNKNNLVFTTEDILSDNWGLMTATLVFRKENLLMPEWFKEVKNGDYALQLLLSLTGKVKCLFDITSVYRRHPGGVSNKLTAFVQCAWLVYLLWEFNIYTQGKYYVEIKRKIKLVYKNQIGFAKEYQLRRALLKLRLFNIIRPLNPFLIKNYR